MDLISITAQLNSLVKETGAFILNERQSFSMDKVSDKGLNQLVSYVDVEAEKQLVSGLKNIVSNAGFITEEHTQPESSGHQLNWIIDPLDGTTNFVHGLPVYSISVALADKGIPVAGAVYEINKDELFTAWKGGGAWLNGQRIYCSAATGMKESLLATGFPYYDFDKMDHYLAVLKYFMQHTHGLRRLGSAAVDLAYVACGRFEGFFEYGLNAWDVAAGALLVEEAGGKVYDFKGGNDYLFGKHIVAGCKGIEQELLATVGKYFNN